MRRVLLAVLFAVAPGWAYGTTYFVAKTGSELTGCGEATSVLTPKLTIAAGLSCMRGGDTLIIGEGVYAEGINNTIPSGTGESKRTKVIGLNGVRWTLRPTSVAQCFIEATTVVYLKNKSFIEIADLILDGTNCSGSSALVVWAGASHDNIMRDSEIKNARNGTGLLLQSGTTFRNVWSKISSHDHGNDRLDHCFYPSGADHRLEYLEGYNCSGHGFHLYKGGSSVNNRNILKSSYFHDNGSYGVGIYGGSDNKVFDNVLINNGTRITPTGGIRLAGNNTEVYSNTIYNHGHGGRCIRIESSADGSIIRDNTCIGDNDNAVSNAGKNTMDANNRVSVGPRPFVKK
jgi:hypothetical protein